MADEQKEKQEDVKTDDDKTQDLAQSGPTEAENEDEIPPPPTEEQMKKWRKRFDELRDVNENISIADVERNWQLDNKNPTGADMETVLKAADKNGDGEISFEEFVEIQTLAEQQDFYMGDTKNELFDALKALDTDGDNAISKEELKALLSGHDDDELTELMTMADTDGDGKLSIQELANLMCNFEEYDQ